MTEEMRLPEQADLWQSTLSWQPTNRQQQQFQAFYEAVVASNRQFNLTRITEPDEFWEKHLWDSLSGIRRLLNSESQSEISRVIDIGTGGGFPGVPIAIACPKWNVTLLDSTNKKVNFLRDAVRKIDALNTRPLVNRVEDVGQNPLHRETYDLAVIRAVAAASVCAEYTLPLLKVGGVASLYRGQWTSEEESTLRSALKQLGGVVEDRDRLETPLTHGVRHILYIRKTKPTDPEFPRPVGVPTQYPLD